MLGAACRDDLTARTAQAVGSGADVVSLTLINGTAQTARVATGFAHTVEIDARDGAGLPVAGATIEIDVPAGGASAIPDARTVVTDANGRASMALHANTVAGAYVVVVHAGAPSQAAAQLELVNTADEASTVTVVAGADQQATVAAQFAGEIVLRVTDPYGNPVAAAPITFEAPPPPAPTAWVMSAGVTDRDGLVHARASAGARAGDIAIGAMIESGARAVIDLVSTADVPARVTPSRASSPQFAQVLGGFRAPLEVFVEDVHGNACVDAVVQFAARGDGALATFAASAVTDSTGTASIPAAANGIAGAYLVTASVVGTDVPATFLLANQADAPAIVTVVGAPSQSTFAAEPFPQPVRVQVRDALGNPAPAVPATFENPATGPHVIVAASTVLTDAEGIAEAHVTAGTQAGHVQIGASVLGGAAPAVTQLVIEPAAPALLIAAPSTTPQRASVETTFGRPLAVVVVDAYGNPVPRTTVTYALDGTIGAQLSHPANVTDADGIARSTLRASRQAGAFQVVAAVAGVTAPLRFDLTALAGAPAVVVAHAGSGQLAVAGQRAADPLVVQVRDRHGNPVEGERVTFTAHLATGPVWLDELETDDGGEVAFVAALPTRAGEHAITATAARGATAATFAVTIAADAPAYAMTVFGSTPQVSPVTQPFRAPLAVAITDVHGNPVPGVPVRFTTAVDVDAGILATPDTVTDSAGIAQTTVVAAARALSYDVLALPAELPPVTFALTNMTGAPHAIAVVAGAGQSAYPARAFAAPLVVRAVDAFGNAIADATVTLAAPAQPATVTPASTILVTDAQGLATTTLVASSTIGAGMITAAVEGATTVTRIAFTTVAVPTALTLVGIGAEADPASPAPVRVRVAVAAVEGVAAGTVDVLDAITGEPRGIATLTRGVAEIVVPRAAIGSGRWVVRYAAQGEFAASATEAFELGLAPAAPDDHDDRDEGDDATGGCATGGGADVGATLLIALMMLMRRPRRAHATAGN